MNDQLHRVTLDPVDIDQVVTEPGLHSADVCQESYMVGARMGFWLGGLVGGLVIFLIIKIGQWWGA